jgi:hypothetical protein
MRQLMKIKIFYGGGYSNLQDEVNEWLSKNKSINILETHQSISPFGDCIISIFYKENQELGDEMDGKSNGYELVKTNINLFCPICNIIMVKDNEHWNHCAIHPEKKYRIQMCVQVTKDESCLT